MKKCLTIYYYYHHYHLILYFTYNWFSTNLCLFFFLLADTFLFFGSADFLFLVSFCRLSTLGWQLISSPVVGTLVKLLTFNFDLFIWTYYFANIFLKLALALFFIGSFLTELSSYIVRGIPVVGIGCCCNQCTLTNFGRFVLCIILCSAIVTHNGPRMFIQFF